MDQDEYNKQSVHWRELKESEPLSSMTYRIPHADVVSYVKEVVDDPDPWYLENSPYGGPIVPPGYFYGQYINLIASVNFPMGALNAKIAFESKRPVLHGEQVTVKGTIARLYKKRGRPYVDIGIDVTSEKGLQVNQGVVTLLLDLNKEE
ncbi:MAG: hypothetical protein JRI80_05605 [Deltaproteobacteria bacterium]|nr:hypothetical protein [Deltaproteobacteria bacterium]